MKKNIVRLSESQLNRVIAESVKKTINEISADLAYNGAQKSDEQFNGIDEVCYICDKLLEKLNDVFFEGQDSFTTSLSPKIAQDLNLDEFKRVVKKFNSRLYKVRERKMKQNMNMHNLYGRKFEELPND